MSILWGSKDQEGLQQEDQGKVEQARKAQKTRTSPGTLGLKKFGLGKLWVKNVFGKYTFKK